MIHNQKDARITKDRDSSPLLSGEPSFFLLACLPVRERVFAQRHGSVVRLAVMHVRCFAICNTMYYNYDGR